MFLLLQFVYYFLLSVSAAQNEPRSQTFVVNMESLRNLWYSATLRGLIKAKARYSLQFVPEVERVVYKTCEQSAKETTELARCAIHLFDARDREIVLNSHYSRNYYSTSEEVLKPRKLKKNQVVKKKTKKKGRNGNAGLDSILAGFQNDLDDFERKNEWKEKRLEKIAEFYEKKLLKQGKLRRKRNRETLSGKRETSSHVDNLRKIKDHIEKTKKIRDYYSLVNKENSRFFTKMYIPVHSREPHIAHDEKDILEDVLALVNDFSTAHLISDSKFSILSPSLFSIFPDLRIQNPKLLSPRVLSFHKDGFFSLPNIFEIVTSNQEYQKQMLDLIMDLSGAGESLKEVINRLQPEMEVVDNIHYPLVLEMSRHDRNWLRARRSFSPEQTEFYERYGFAYLDRDQMESVYSNNKFTHGARFNITETSEKSKEEQDRDIEEYIRSIAKIKRKESRPKRETEKESENSGKPKEENEEEKERINGIEFQTLKPIVFTNFIGEGATMGAVTLSPGFFITEILSTETLTLKTLSPEAMVASILAPAALVARVLSPSALRAEILSPRAFHPWILSPEALVAEVLVPRAFEPRIMSPEVLVIDILSPAFLSPYIGSPNAFGVIVLSPNILSPRIESEEHFMVQILSPDILGGEHLAGEHEEHGDVIVIGAEEHDQDDNREHDGSV